MRHAHARHDAGGADRARADADLHAVRTRFNQGQSGCTGGDVAANDFDVRIVLLDPAHAIDHTFAVAVRGVHHNGVHTCARERLDTLFGALTHTHGGTHAQFASSVTGGIGEIELFGDVLDGDQALEFKGVVDHQQPLEFVLVEQVLGLFGGGALGDSDQAITRRHDFTDLLVVAGFETQVSARHDTDHFAAITHRKSGHAQFF